LHTIPHVLGEVAHGHTAFSDRAGLLILIAGIAHGHVLSRIGLGRLPGDFMIERGGTTFYFPLVTCIIISVVLSALLWLFNR